PQAAPRTAVALPTAPQPGVPATRACRPAAFPVALTGSAPTIASVGPVPGRPVEFPSTIQEQDSTGAGLFWWILGAGAAAGGATTIGGGSSGPPGGAAGVPVGPVAVVPPVVPQTPGATPGDEQPPTSGTPNTPEPPSQQPPPDIPPPPLVGSVPPDFPPGTVPPGTTPPGSPPGDTPPGIPPGGDPPGGNPPGGNPPGGDPPPGDTPPPGITQVVPEPGTLSLVLGGGVVLLAGLRARRRR
ncbi:PEP-CTERM sorting domain-containing protein, partial [Roseisolibacter sp. H3M3-2]|uniref:PEP-CTERM sorting domain-containing protein n=1 Tax=Roseisolibacter sp. H3M3-2 TaxID=3031323 RepID=UPI0023DBF52A